MPEPKSHVALCPACSRELPADATACPHCGRQLDLPPLFTTHETAVPVSSPSAARVQARWGAGMLRPGSAQRAAMVVSILAVIVLLLAFVLLGR